MNIYEPICIIPFANKRYWIIILLYRLSILCMPMTSYVCYQISKKSKSVMTKTNIFSLKSTPQEGHFEVLIIQFASETKKIYTKMYFDNASIMLRDFHFRRLLQGLEFDLYLFCLGTDFNNWYLKIIGLECSFQEK